MKKFISINQTRITHSEKVTMMRIFSLILILIISLQSLSKADDISEFEIEGMSINDSLIDFFDHLDLNEQIINNYPKATYPGSDKFFGLRINKKLGDYDNFGVLLKKDDKKYIIYVLRGRINFENRLEDCKKYKLNVVNSIKDLLPNITPHDYTHNYKIDEGKSISYITDFNFEDGSSIRAYCDNWSNIVEKNERWVDSMSVEISTAEAVNWINNEAYN